MESWSLQSPGVTALPSSRNGLVDKPFIFGQTLKLPNLKENPCARNIKLLSIRSKASGLAKSGSGKTEAVLEKADSKEGDLVFVAGATGKVGSRTVRELLKLGFCVRAGVRSANRAEALIQSVKQMKLENAEGLQPVEKLEIVECDLEKPDQIVPAIGKSSVVICSIGASEKEVFDVTGPCRIDYGATKNLVDAAKSAKVNHFILVSSLGTNKFGFPAAILNLFWGVLIWKRKAEEALIASGIPYTIVRPGGMERPTDAYKETHNITLSVEDTLFGGQVSNLQVAELMAVMAKNPALSQCKIVEVIAETTAPLTPMEELLAKIPSQRVKPEVAIAVEDSTSSTSNVLVAEPPTTSSKKEESTMSAVTSRRPLSPYTAYDDLKPPTSPTPTSPSSQKGNEDTIEATLKTKATENEGTVVGSAPGIDIAKTIQEAVPKAQPLSPSTAYDDLKPPTSQSPTSPSNKKGNEDAVVAVAEVSAADSQATIVVPETSSEAADKANEDGAVTAAGISALDSQTSVVPETGVEATQSNQKVVPKPHPLSPYTAYDDLKPPTSPSPTSSGSQKGNVYTADATTNVNAMKSQSSVVPESGIGAAEADEKVFEKEKQLSPYNTYNDMKPPASPSSSFGGPGEIPYVASTNKTMESPTGGNDVASPGALKTVKMGATKDPSFYRSPYFVYNDFKPPTSPSPSQPNASSLPVSSGTSDIGATKPSTTITPKHEEVHEKQKLKPLSPYTMYEDLKPPTSPTPFPNNF